MDKIDRHILEVLQKEARLSTAELSERVGLSPSPCARRLKRLEDEGYTLGLKSTKLSPIVIAIVISYTSFFLTLAMVLFGVVETNIGAVSFDEALPFILVQGIGVGVVSTIAFSYAVKQLGSIRTLLLGSLSPGLTAILAALILNESLSVIMICGIVLSTIGVILSSRAQ